MPRSPAPPWRRRLEPVLDHLLHASMEQANGIMNAETGHYAELVYAGCPTKDRAMEIKRALFRAGKHVGCSVSAKVERTGDEWQVRFTAIDKNKARQYVMDRYGPDRSKWPYSPFRKDPNFNS